mgnify:CR=1 FL=1
MNHQLKYLVLSDLHLGEKDSLFTEEGSGKDLLVAFSECLADLLLQFNEDGELRRSKML